MVDINKPVENPDLVRAIEEHRAGNSSTAERNLLAAIQAANYLVVLDKPLELEDVDETGKGTLKKNSAFGIPLIEDVEGNRYSFGFTDWNELVKWSGKPASETQTLVMPFSDVAAMVSSKQLDCAGFVINPKSHNQLVPLQLVARMMENPAAYTVKQDTKVKLGVPADYPHEMVEAIKKAARPVPQVEKLYLLLMQKENGEQSFLIVAEGTEDVRQAFVGIGNAAASFLPKGMYLDMVPAIDPFGQDAIQGQQPFYTRGVD